MAAGNSGDIQMNGNVDWNAIAKQTLRYQYDAKRASVCLWFILFFFNAEQRRERRISGSRYGTISPLWSRWRCRSRLPS